MDKLAMCRICLAEDVRMHLIAATHLQNIFEDLTKIPFKTEDSRPLQACYICWARLQNCYQLRESCLQSEELFTQMLKGNVIKPLGLQENLNRKVLKIVHPVVQLDVLDGLQTDAYSVGRVDVPEMVYDVKIEPVDTEDRFEENLEIECEIQSLSSQYDIPLEIIKQEPDDITATIKTENEEEIQHGTEDSFQAINKEEGCMSIGIIKSEINYREPSVTTPAQCSSRHSATGIHTSESQQRNDCDITFNKNIDTITLKNKLDSSHDKKILENNDSSTYTHVSGDNIKSNLFNNQNASLTIKSVSKIKQFECNICQKCFRRKTDLGRHYRIHTGEKPFVCDVCNKGFNQKKTLKTHSQVHTGEKPYQCDICKKSFNQTSHLDCHVRIHTGEKPYECDICKKCFIQKSDLNKHTRIHTGEKPYQCNVCKKSFIQKSDLNKHTMIHTGERPYQCTLCKKGFCRKDNLEQHVRIHDVQKPT